MIATIQYHNGITPIKPLKYIVIRDYYIMIFILVNMNGWKLYFHTNEIIRINPYARHTHLITGDELSSSDIIHKQLEQICMLVYSFQKKSLDTISFKKCVSRMIGFFSPHDQQPQLLYLILSKTLFLVILWPIRPMLLLPHQPIYWLIGHRENLLDTKSILLGNPTPNQSTML